MLTSLSNIYCHTLTRYSVLDRKTIKRAILELPGSGCEYFKKKGGCSFCGFHNSTNRYTRGYRYPGFLFKWLYGLAEKRIESHTPSELRIYNGGSFWNDNEIPPAFQNHLYKKVSQSKVINRLTIESRCEYIHQEKIDAAKACLMGKNLLVGIGLESQDDHIRNHIIRKGLSRKTLEKKVSLLRNNEVDVLVYIFLKPFSLDEKRAYEEVLKSIEYALSIGVSDIEISCAFVQENTPLATHYQNGDFRPPYLWTILKLIDEVENNRWPASIGGFTDTPPPVAGPSNCEKCTEIISSAIEMFRQYRVRDAIVPCECRKPWEQMMQ